MEKIALALLAVIAVVAFVGLVKIDTNAGNAYYDSYARVPMSKLSGRITNTAGASLNAVGNAGLVGQGTVQGGTYELQLFDNWRINDNIDMYVDGKFCASVPVAVLLNAQQILYNGVVVYDLQCR